MKIKISILVVIYNKEISESTTILTLLDKKLENVHLVIHNNGPKEITFPIGFQESFEKNGNSVFLENCIENKPLSNLYNDFIEANKISDKFIILDDDSEITSSYVEAIKHTDYDIEIPKIVSRVDDQTYYPLSHNRVVTDNGFIDVNGTHSIGSGLIFTKRIVSIFEKYKLPLFDENYALYGVDVSFFRGLWYLNKKGECFKLKSSSSIVHSLSRTEGPESEFRKVERLIDYAISVRRYPSLRSYASLTKRALRQLITLDIKGFRLMFHSFFVGTHPRSIRWKNRVILSNRTKN